ncbi:MAG: S-adenosylmethionine decarboxylase [Alkalilacustris sp.]
MLDIDHANPARLADPAGLDRVLAGVIAALGMHPIHETALGEVGPKNRKHSRGLSGFAMIAESHISIHTFPRRGFASMDIYTCKSGIDADLVLRLVREGLARVDIDFFRQPRGIRYPLANLA